MIKELAEFTRVMRQVRAAEKVSSRQEPRKERRRRRRESRHRQLLDRWASIAEL